jgi:hypothetical protein
MHPQMHKTGSKNPRYIRFHLFIGINIFHFIVKLDPDMGSQFHNTPGAEFDKNARYGYF